MAKLDWILLLNLLKRIFMRTEILIPETNLLRLQIPDSFIGKEIEVVIDEENATITLRKITPQKFEKASDIFKDCRVSFKDFKFNRDEANDYE
jgi:hypothetical protein